MEQDPLYFLKEATRNITGNLSTSPFVASQATTVSLSKIVLNLFLVLILVAISLLILKFFTKYKQSSKHLLKEVQLTPQLKIVLFKLGKKLYIIGSKSNHSFLIDTISDEKEIIDLLSEDQVSDGNLSLSHTLKKAAGFKNHLETSISSIIKNSDELEELNSK
jgi:flagellar biogenesis protein FliO